MNNIYILYFKHLYVKIYIYCKYTHTNNSLNIYLRVFYEKRDNCTEDTLIMSNTAKYVQIPST